jgi:Flp pilus assembly protein TadG
MRMPDQANRAISRLRRHAWSLWRQREGIAALEFALLAPLAIYTLLAFSDITAALTLTRHMTNAVDTIAELASQQTEGGTPTQPGTPTSTISDAEVLEDFDSILTTMPEMTANAAAKQENWTSDVQAILSSIEFGPLSTCQVPTPNPNGGTNNSTQTCSPYVMWSVGFANTGTGFPVSHRTCGRTTYLASNFTSPSLTAISPGAQTPGSVLSPGTTIAPGTIMVADLQYTFAPTFTKWLTGSFTFQRTAYFPPRFFTIMAYAAPNANPTNTGSGNNTQSGYTDGLLVSCQFTGTVPATPTSPS